MTRPRFTYEGAVLAALAQRYQPPEWAFFTHVADGTGGHKSRTADALAMNLWPGRGLELHAFEVKTDRRDLMRELKNPAKAEAIQKYCDRFWLAIGDEVSLEGIDLPVTWGLLAPGPRGDFRVKRQAPKLKPKAVDRQFLAAVLRAAQSKDANAQTQLVEERVKARLAQEAERQQSVDAATAKFEKQRADGLEALIAKFAEHSGLNLKQYQWSNNLRHLGEAAKAVMTNRGLVRREVQVLKGLLAQARSIATRFEEAAAALEQAAAEEPLKEADTDAA